MNRYQVFCGLDVGKEVHHATALDGQGRRLHDAPLAQDEASIRGLLERLGEHGRVLVVVDQPNTIGRYRWRWRGRWVSRWRTCPGWRCAGSPICIRVMPRPTPATPVIAEAARAACRTRCAGSTSTMRRWPS